MTPRLVIALSVLALLQGHLATSNRHETRSVARGARLEASATPRGDAFTIPELTVYGSPMHHASKPQGERRFVCGDWEPLDSSLLHVQRCEWIAR